MRELHETLAAWQAEGQGIGRAIVVRTFGSAPRPEGAVMLVAEDGRLAGSVSGGCVEGAAFEEVERARARRVAAGSSATASATSRPGTSGSPAAARSTS